MLRITHPIPTFPPPSPTGQYEDVPVFEYFGRRPSKSPHGQGAFETYVLEDNRVFSVDDPDRARAEKAWRNLSFERARIL